MKALNELLTHEDEELREFARCFEAVAEYTNLDSVTLNKLHIGLLSRAIQQPLTQLDTRNGTHYSIELLVRNKPVEFYCFIPTNEPK